MFKEILDFYQYPDKDVWKLLLEGVPLKGEIPKSGVFPPKSRPGTITPDALTRIASKVNESALKHAKASEDNELDHETWEKTKDEIAKGWITEPVRPDEIPKDFPLARRFGLRQKKGKIRLIDDFSCSMTNSSTVSHEKPVLDTVDVICSSVLYYFDVCKKTGRSPKLVIKTCDLKAAYKQVGIKPQSSPFAHVCVYSPQHRCPMVFRSIAMPFGACQSVPGVLRLSRALWFVACVALQVINTNFFDDYVLISEEATSKSASQAFENLLRLLGWSFDQEGPKATTFGRTADALGITIGLSKSEQYIMSLRNTNSRKAEILTELDEVLKTGELSKARALQLRGRLGFAENQIFGRVARKSMRVIVEHAFYAGGDSIGRDLQFALKTLRSVAATGPDRVLSGISCLTFLVLTDASYEDGKAGLGGILIGPSGKPMQYFSYFLNPEELQALGAQERQSIIRECEMIAVVAAFEVWQNILKCTQVIFCLDNDGARYNLLAGFGKSVISNIITGKFVELSTAIQTWLARGPLPSNLADLPSRDECEYLDMKGSKRVCVNLGRVLGRTKAVDVRRSDITERGEGSRCLRRYAILYRTPFKTHRDPDLRRRRKTKSGAPHSKVRSIAAVHTCVEGMSQEGF